MSTVDTITAVATPPGRGGIAVVRVSGSLVKYIIKKIVGKDIKPRAAVYSPFYDKNQDVLDEGLALFFPNPHSFTGEDVLELQGHGGPVIVDALVKRIIECGARLARPGEFSERAFLNDKLDLTQAEAIADLIDAQSETAARLAMRSLQGEFSSAIQQLNEKIIYLRMYVEAAIDFTDEEIDFLADDKVRTSLEEIIATLKTIQNQAAQGSLLREGMTIVIAGEPNVGKSSLLNALSGKELAIVTDIPGTTRDVLRDHILIDGIPVHIIDTAGLRTSDDIVEREGIKRAKNEIESADMVFYLHDAVRHGDMVVHDELLESAHTKNMIHIRNKIDLVNEQPSIDSLNNKTVVSISAKQNVGIDLLKSHIKSLVGYQDQTEGVFLARRRHLDALDRASTFLDQSRIQLTHKSGELAAEDLRLAHFALSEITGEFSSDDLLGRIFSSFCIGK